MLHGDIDNRPAPTIAVDLDVLWTPSGLWASRLGRAALRLPALLYQAVTPDIKAYRIMEDWMLKGLGVYILAFLPREAEGLLQKKFDHWPVNWVVCVDDVMRDEILSWQHVIWFAYRDSAHHSLRWSSKCQQVQTLRDFRL